MRLANWCHTCFTITVIEIGQSFVFSSNSTGKLKSVPSSWIPNKSTSRVDQRGYWILFWTCVESSKILKVQPTVLTSLHFLSFELKNWNNICVILHYFSNQTWYFRAKKSEHGKFFAWLFLSSKQHQTVLNIQRLLLCSSERICTETFVGMATSTVLQPIIILLRCGKNSSALVTLLLGSEDSKWQWDFYSSPECNGQSGAQGKVSLLLTPRKLELACRSTTCLGIFHRWITPLRLPHISVPRLFLLFSRNNLLLNKTRLIVHCLAREKSACPRPTVDNDLDGEIYLFRSILWPKKCTL